MSEARRSTGARTGVTLLNVLVPGLGLLRLGSWRAGLLFAFAPVAWLLIVLAVAASASDVSYPALIVVVVLSLLLAAGAYLGSMLLTWRRSGIRRPLHWWSRWYVLIAFFLAYQLITWPITPLVHRHYRPFYIPAEGMLPTLRVNERLIAAMGRPESIDRGDIVLVRTELDHIYIKRVAALSGDRIALRGGVVVLNGRPVAQRPVGRDRITDFDGPLMALRMEERFPGELGSHFVYDLGSSATDQWEETRVAPGHVFVLGDNRDRSADSRVAKPMGLEQVRVEDVVGRPILITWSSDPARRGIRLNR